MNKALKKRQRDTGWCSYVQAKEIRFPIHPYHFNTPQISREITTVFGKGQSPLGSNQAVGGGAQLSRGSRESESATGHRREGAELATTPSTCWHHTREQGQPSSSWFLSKSQDQHRGCTSVSTTPQVFLRFSCELGSYGPKWEKPKNEKTWIWSLALLLQVPHLHHRSTKQYKMQAHSGNRDVIFKREVLRQSCWTHSTVWSPSFSLARGASGTVYHLRDKRRMLSTSLVSSIFQL